MREPLRVSPVGYSGVHRQGMHKAQHIEERRGREAPLFLLEERRGPWWDEDEFKFHHYLLCGARVVSSPLWSVSSKDRPAHQPPLQRGRQQQENQNPLTGRKIEAEVARGAPRSPSAVQGVRDTDLRAQCSLRVPTMAVPLSSAPGLRPTGSWAPAHWAKGPATCCACASTHAPPPPPPPPRLGRGYLSPPRLSSPRPRAPSPRCRSQTWWVSPALPPESARRPYSRPGWSLRTWANEAPGVCPELSPTRALVAIATQGR